MTLLNKTIKVEPPADMTALGSFYAVSEKWHSDLVFFEIEMNFFEKVLENNILFSRVDKNLNSLKEFHVQLSALMRDRDGIYTRILEHLDMLAKCSKNLPELAANIGSAHEKLEKETYFFFRNYRLFKGELYKAAGMLSSNPAADFMNS